MSKITHKDYKQMSEIVHATWDMEGLEVVELINDQGVRSILIKEKKK